MNTKVVRVTCTECGDSFDFTPCCPFHDEPHYRKLHKKTCAYLKAFTRPYRRIIENSHGIMEPVPGDETRQRLKVDDFESMAVSMDYVAAHGIPLTNELLS